MYLIECANAYLAAVQLQQKEMDYQTDGAGHLPLSGRRRGGGIPEGTQGAGHDAGGG